MQEQVLLRIKDVAIMLGASSSTVKRWCNESKIAFTYTVGGQRRIPKSEVERIKSTQPLDRAERAERQTRAAREARAKNRIERLNADETPSETNKKTVETGLDIDEDDVVAFGEEMKQWRDKRDASKRISPPRLYFNTCKSKNNTDIVDTAGIIPPTPSTQPTSPTPSPSSQPVMGFPPHNGNFPSTAENE